MAKHLRMTAASRLPRTTGTGSLLLSAQGREDVDCAATTKTPGRLDRMDAVNTSPKRHSRSQPLDPTIFTLSFTPSTSSRPATPSPTGAPVLPYPLPLPILSLTPASPDSSFDFIPAGEAYQRVIMLPDEPESVEEDEQDQYSEEMDVTAAATTIDPTSDWQEDEPAWAADLAALTRCPRFENAEADDSDEKSDSPWHSVITLAHLPTPGSDDDDFNEKSDGTPLEMRQLPISYSSSRPKHLEVPETASTGRLLASPPSPAPCAYSRAVALQPSTRRICGNRRRMGLCCLLLVGVVVGISVGLGQAYVRAKSGHSATQQQEQQPSPSPSPIHHRNSQPAFHGATADLPTSLMTAPARLSTTLPSPAMAMSTSSTRPAPPTPTHSLSTLDAERDTDEDEDEQEEDEDTEEAPHGPRRHPRIEERWGPLLQVRMLAAQGGHGFGGGRARGIR